MLYAFLSTAPSWPSIRNISTLPDPWQIQLQSFIHFLVAPIFAWFLYLSTTPQWEQFALLWLSSPALGGLIDHDLVSYPDPALSSPCLLPWFPAFLLLLCTLFSAGVCSSWIGATSTIDSRWSLIVINLHAPPDCPRHWHVLPNFPIASSILLCDALERFSCSWPSCRVISFSILVTFLYIHAFIFHGM